MTRRASILILVLWAVVILSLLCGGIAFAVRQDLALAGIDKSRMVAHWTARAGIERAIASLMDDISPTDSTLDTWSNNENAFKQIAVGDGSFSVLEDRFEEVPLDWSGVNDEAAKLNVNVATREQLMKLRDMTAPVAAAIIDWRDRDENPEPDGIERGHYASLPHPYTIRNGPLRTTRELLMVRGVTPELFYGEDANGDGRLDPNENDGDKTPPADNSDGKLDRGWFAYLTVFTFEKNQSVLGKKRTNLKTADANTLSTDLQLEGWAAQSIVKRRGEREFKHIVDLLDVPLDPSASRGSASDDLNGRDDNEKNQPVTRSILKRIIDNLTLSEEDTLPGRVNINTAPLAVLKTLMDDDLAQAVERQRKSGTTFSSIADLLDISGMTNEKFGKLESFVTVRSCVFRILSRGDASTGLASEWIECVVDRSERNPRVLYWMESTP